MKAGYLSDYFTGIAAKLLSAVEADPARSHQHEFNGVDALKRIFSEAPDKKKFKTRFIYLNDRDDAPVTANAELTWYDARAQHPTRSEHRLYFPSNSVTQRAAEGDLLILGRRPDESILVVIAEKGSTTANQVQWLFGVSDLSRPGFSIREELKTDHDRLQFASRLILENIGVQVEPADETYLEAMLAKFGGGFPTTNEFSKYARSTLVDVNPNDDTDGALMAWMEREEVLFRALERHLIADRLSAGFKGDVDDFISFSLSVQNRRKSRVGYALENHMETIFIESGIRYSRAPATTTENKAKPDFLFPGREQYHDPEFNSARLTMLGVKSSCKDRWRQVLSEADRIPHKHLLTLETAISDTQTDEMKAKSLSLVLPKSLHATYTRDQQPWLMDLGSFVKLIRSRN